MSQVPTSLALALAMFTTPEETVKRWEFYIVKNKEGKGKGRRFETKAITREQAKVRAEIHAENVLHLPKDEYNVKNLTFLEELPMTA